MRSAPLLALALVTAGGAARAEESAARDALLASLAIEWSAPAGCPTVDHVRTEVRALLAQAKSPPDTTDALSFRGAVTQSDAHWSLRAEIGSRSTKQWKNLDAESCAALSDAFALIVAFAIDPQASALPEAIPAAAPQPEPTQPEAPPALAPISPGDGRRLTLAIGPLAATGAGFLPLPAWGVGARVAMTSRIRWELGAMLWPEREAMLSGALAGVGARIGLWSADFSACLPFEGTVLAVCSAAELGIMRAQGVVAAPATKNSWWGALRAGAAADLAFSKHIGVRFRVDGGVSLFRPAIALDHVGPPGPVRVFRPSPVFVLVSVEPELRFSTTDSNSAGH